MQESPYQYQFGPEHEYFMKWQIAEAASNLEMYSELTRREQEQMGDYLPAKPRKVMDLGCGLGRAAIGLHQRWQDPDIRYILADKTCSSQVPDCWDEFPDVPWNDLELTRSFAKRNGLPSFEVFDLANGDWAKLGNGIDLVISCCSVGMHFPIENVMPRLLEATTKDCTMIFGTRAQPSYATFFNWLFKEVIWLPQPPQDPYPHQDWLILRGKA